eukprot:7948099-Lingulodinium_polyedra.AAC.1
MANGPIVWVTFARVQKHCALHGSTQFPTPLTGVWATEAKFLGPDRPGPPLLAKHLLTPKSLRTAR